MRTSVLFLLVAACLGLAACQSSVNVSATSNVNARYSSVFITVKEVWVNESATAAPDDTTWQKFPLSTPVTFDLVGLNSGTLSQFASQLAIPTGTYRQMRLLLADRSAPLTDSAKSLSATFNNEVTSFDSAGTQTTLPLEVANAAQGIGIEMELVVPAPTEAILAALGSASTSTTTDTSSATSLIDSTGTPTTTTIPAATTPTTPSSSSTGTTASGSATTTVTANAYVVFDAARDLTDFQFSDRPGFLLNPSLKAYDAANLGTIRGQLDLSLLTISTGTGRPDIEVTAEALNDDSTRRVEVASAPVLANGTFMLYPLPPSASATHSTACDLVIHGPGVRTIIIRAVPVTKGTPDQATDVALGTVTLTASDSYSTNLDTNSTVSPRGARVGFYQTLPDDNAPFLIEQRPVDPLSGRFVTDQLLSNATTVVYATFGTAFSFLASAPQEGASKYSVAALSSFYGNGDFGNTLLTPTTVAATPATFTVPDVPLPSGSSAGTISATVSVATAGKYDKGALLVTHNGTVITVASLDEALAGAAASTVVSVTNVPGSTASGFERGLYYLEAWAWSSADPDGTFTRQPVSGAVDLRTTLTANAAVTIN
ncbi:MAG: DUF4382 domain-containing protein [Gammaproteobacteria bacterium]